MTKTKSHLHKQVNPIKLLIVDDDKELLGFLVEYFEFKGYECDCAKDGNVALDLLVSRTFDALVTDVAMPGLNGIELLIKLNELNPSLPKVVLSGESEFRDVVANIDRTTTRFFNKPIRDLEDLDRTIRELIASIGSSHEEHNKTVHTTNFKINSSKPKAEKLGQVADRNEQYYRTLLESGNDAFLLFNRDGKIIDLNQNLSRIFGLSRSELLGRYADSDDFNPGLRLFFHQTRELGQQGGEVRFEFELHRTDGSIRQVEVRSVSCLDSELGEQIVYVTDLSDYNRRLQILKTRNDQLLTTLAARGEPVRLNSGTLNNFIELANAFVFIIDRQTDVLEWNPAAERISGYSRKVATKPGIIKHLFKDYDQFASLLDNEIFITGGGVENYELDILTIDGETKSIKWNINAIKETGKTVGAMLVGTDVTAERELRDELEKYTNQLEETVGDRTRELTKSQERFQSLFEGVRDAVFVTDCHAGLIEVNPAWLRLLGYNSKTEVIGRHFINDFALSSSDADELLRLLQNNQYVQDHLIQLKRRDGSIVSTLVSITLQKTECDEGAGYEGIIRDVTRLRQLEQKLIEHSQNLEDLVKSRSAELAESEAKFRRLTENSPDIIYRIDMRRMKFDYISPAAEFTTGYSIEKLRQFGPDGFVSRIHAKEASKVIELWASLAEDNPETRKTFHIEYRFIRSDGETIWLSDHGIAIRAGSGELVAVEGVIHDITTQKNVAVDLEEHANLLEQEVHRRTTALAESEYRYRMLLSEAGDIIFTCNMEGKIQEINRRGEDLLGRNISEINKASFGALLDESSRRRFNKALMSCFKAGIKPEPYQIEYQTPRGSKLLLEIQSSPLIIEDRVVLCMMVARDLTSRRRAAQAIRTLKEFNEGIVHSMSEGIFIENDDGVCEFVNPAMAEMLGYKQIEVEGRHHYDFVPPSERDFVANQGEICRLRGFARYEVKLIASTGEEVPVHISSRLRTEGGKIVGALSVVTDLRQTKEMEGRQRFMERLLADERKLADIGMLAAGIAHNISSPLMVISGYAQLLKTKLPKVKEFDVILGQIDKISEITRNMMIKSRSEQDKGVKLIDINDLLQTELKFLEANLNFKSKIDKQYNFDNRVPSIKGVYSDFSQAFSNIINNALDAMYNRQVRRLAVSTTNTGSEIVIVISDTGGGISKENLKKIFDPFFTTKPPVGDVKEGEPTGTGLGLSTSQQLINNYGGRIEVDSEPDVGTKFTITLPITGSLETGSLTKKAPKVPVIA